MRVKNMKASNECFAYIPLANNAQIRDIQLKLKARFTDDRIEWQTPDTYHITLVYANQGTYSALDDVISNVELPDSIEVYGDTVEVFDTPDGWAVHVRLYPMETLMDTQAEVFRWMSELCGGLSDFSKPDDYNPHITLCYMPKDIEPPAGELGVVDTFADSVIIGRDDYRPYGVISNTKQAPENTTFDSVTYNGVTVQASPVRPSSRVDKKYMRWVRYDGDERLVHWGQPGEQMERDNDEARGNFNSRHQCSTKKDPFAPGFWACWAWQPNAPIPGGKSREATMTDDKRIAFGGAIKAMPNGIIEGYLVPFYSDNSIRDWDGEYFDSRTDYDLEHFPVEAKPVTYRHGLDETLGSRAIGRVLKSRVDNVGIWVQSQLDMRDEWEKAVYELAKKGKLGWSSGAWPQSVEVEKDGHIKTWKIIEAALTPTPADPTRLTQINTYKTLTDGVRLKGFLEDIEANASAERDGDLNISEDENQEEEDRTMSPEELRNFIISVVEEYNAKMKQDGEMTEEESNAVAEAMADEVEAKMDDELPENVQKMDEEEVKSAVLKTISDNMKTLFSVGFAAQARVRAANDKKMTEALKAARNEADIPVNDRKSRAGRPAAQGGSSIQVSSKFHNMSADDMSFAIDLWNSGYKSGNWRPTQEFYREYADKLEREAGNGRYVDAKTANFVKSIKDDEVMYSTLSTYGDEFVPTSWRQEIWERSRLDNVILPLFEQVEMPTNPHVHPVESSDPTVYYVGETNDEAQLTISGSGAALPDSQISTSNITLSAQKLATRIGISAELAEDGIAATIPHFRRQAIRTLEDAIDNTLVNGDTAASGNINLDGGTPAVTASYKAFNGLIKQGLVTDSATSALNFSGAAPTLAKIRELRFKLAAGNTRVDRLAMIVHPEVEAVLLNMDEFVTMDKAGSRATNMTGQLGILDGMPVFVSAEIALADTDGKVTSGGNVADTGRIVIVHRDHFKVGFRRNITQTLDFVPWHETWQLIVSARLDIKQTIARSVVVGYNVGV